MIILCANEILYQRIPSRKSDPLSNNLYPSLLSMFVPLVFYLCFSALICKFNGSEDPFPK
uniref:Uncharacterized protein n=1 Tax=Triticum urartu TaxID=4572 RepID=A0A8R7QXB5_TRIUA